MTRKRVIKEIIKDLFPGVEFSRYFSSFDIVGDIAILKLPKMQISRKREVAARLQKRLPRLSTVLEQIRPTSGEHRIRGLRWLFGERRTHTIHSENGCKFAIDLKSVFFSPRLSHERARIANLVANQGKREAIVNMFAGAGCFSIVTLKRAPECIVYSMDINPQAVRYMIRNIRMNKRSHRIVPMLGDSRNLTERFFTGKTDRVLLPLPEKSMLYLDTAISAIKKQGGIIHLYDSVDTPKRREAADIIAEKLRKKLINCSRDFKLKLKRVVRSIGPRRYQVVVDLEILPIAV